MLVCRCCLTFEDNLYPFATYRSAFRDCTGLHVEGSALICPSCIRKLGEAHAFRETSLKSDEILKKQGALGESSDVVVKKEPVDEDDYDDRDAFTDHFAQFEPMVKVETKAEFKSKYGNDDEVSEDDDDLPFVSVDLPEVEPEEPKVKKSWNKKTEKVFENPESLANSIRARLAWAQGTKENLIKECPFCFLSGLKKIDLKKHVQEHVIANGGFECDHCSRKFMQKRTLKNHLLRVVLGRKGGPSTFVCLECHEIFLELDLMRQHYADLHPGCQVPEPVSVGPFQCSECDKILSSKHCLIMHEMKHTDTRPFVCATCGHGFRTKEQLRTHELTHTGELPFLCTECGKGFRSKGQLRSHTLYSHRGVPRAKKPSKRKIKHEGPFACDLCGKEFKGRNLLKSHMISHDDAMNHSCEICGMKFKRLSTWRHHQSTHKEQRDFSCGNCGTVFKQRFALKRHMGQHALKMGLHEKSFELRKVDSAIRGFKVEGFVIQGLPRYTEQTPNL